VSFEDPAEPGVDKPDFDSTPDDIPDNDSGGNPDDETDDENGGDGSGDPNDPMEDEDPTLDEDDQDVEDIEICDIALINTIAEIDEPEQVGDTVKFEVVVINQGNRDANSVSVNYTVPNGLGYLALNDDLMPMWDETNDSLAQVVTTDTLSPGERDTVCIYLELMNLPSDEVTPDSWTTIAEVLQITDSEDVVKIEDIDSTPDDDPTNDPGGNPDDETNDEEEGDGTGDPDDPMEDVDPTLDEDDHDPELVEICDAALVIDTEEEGPFSYGDTIKYFVEISNHSICLYMEIVPDYESSEDSWLQNAEIVSFEDPAEPGVDKPDLVHRMIYQTMIQVEIQMILQMMKMEEMEVETLLIR